MLLWLSVDIQCLFHEVAAVPWEIWVSQASAGGLDPALLVDLVAVNSPKLNIEHDQTLDKNTNQINL